MFRIKQHIFGDKPRFPRITFGIVGYTHVEGRLWGYYTKVQGNRTYRIYVPHIIKGIINVCKTHFIFKHKR